MFRSTAFMSTIEKEAVYRYWKNFLLGGFKRPLFMNKLYRHLSLHCGFIAHYSHDVFYDTYFTSPVDILEFIQEFVAYKQSWTYGDGDYNDINTAMLEFLIENYDGIVGKLRAIAS